MWNWLRWLNPLNWFKTDPAEAINAVREKTVQLCGFLPTATTVANILAAGNPAVVGVSAVATAICQVMTPRKGTMVAAMSPPPPYVNGILVEGEWIDERDT